MHLPDALDRASRPPAPAVFDGPSLRLSTSGTRRRRAWIGTIAAALVVVLAASSALVWRWWDDQPHARWTPVTSVSRDEVVRRCKAQGRVLWPEQKTYVPSQTVKVDDEFCPIGITRVSQNPVPWDQVRDVTDRPRLRHLCGAMGGVNFSGWQVLTTRLVAERLDPTLPPLATRVVLLRSANRWLATCWLTPDRYGLNWGRVSFQLVPDRPGAVTLTIVPEFQQDATGVPAVREYALSSGWLVLDARGRPDFDAATLVVTASSLGEVRFVVERGAVIPPDELIPPLNRTAFDLNAAGLLPYTFRVLDAKGRVLRTGTVT